MKTNLMKLNRKGRNHRVLQVVIVFLVLVSIATNLVGCAYRTYTGSIGDAMFLFQYRKNDCVNPFLPYPVSSHNPYYGLGDPPLGLQTPEGCFYTDSYINVNVYAKNEIIYNAETNLEDFISSLNGNEYLRDLEFGERGTVIIAGITAEYVYYYYTGFTTLPYYYEGKCASFTYGAYIIEIDVLFETDSLDTDMVFDLIVETFEILD